ncbi:MAG: molybdopterin-dependent oxidoreductase, partial [Anaerolineaceae bacterium]|nr:molybdopterin-dependent oxidoreductase [Anaerolineaceae bacterium]
ESNIGKMGAETAILVVASDLEEEAPVWYLRVRAAAKRGATLIVVNARPTKLDHLAAHVLRYAYGDEASTIRGLLAGEQDPSAINAAAQAFAGAENAVIFFGSDGLGLDGSRSLAEACAELLLKTKHTGRVNNGLVGVWPKANLQGAWDMGYAPVDDLVGALQGAGAVYAAAADPAGDDPRLAKALESAGFVVVQELFLSETAKMADVVLPVLSFIEREGTFTSGERRVQRFYPAVAAVHGPRADFRITADLAQRLGQEVEGRAASLVMGKIALQIADYAEVTYPKLAQVHEQWPIVHREDLFYGGTSYQNRQGLGIALQPGVMSGTWQYDPAAEESVVKPSANGRQPGDILVVPVTRLYDRGTTVLPSQLIHTRMARAEVWLHPNIASRLQLANDDMAALILENATAAVQVKLDETLPEGVALVPRSVGISISAPQVGELQRLAQEAASGAEKPVGEKQGSAR